MSKSFGDKLADMTEEQLSSLKAPEMRKALEGARNSMISRIRQFGKHEVVSQAILAYLDHADSKRYKQKYNTLVNRLKKMDFDKMSRNKQYLELAKMQQFFQSETATLRGAYRVNKEQDIRIFGKGKYGLPLDTMDDKTRTKYWEVYHEYENAHEGMLGTPQHSETFQILLGEMMKSGQVTREDLAEAITKLDEAFKERLANEERTKFEPNVMQGFR